MKIVSIDVGVKNLGVCLINYDINAYDNENLKNINIVNTDETITSLTTLHQIKKTRVKRTIIKKKSILDKLCFTHIHDWKLFNILENIERTSEIHNKHCCFIQKNKKQCLSKASFYFKDDMNSFEFYCKKHSNHIYHLFPSSCYTKSTLQIKTVEQLVDFKKEHFIYFGETHDIEIKLKKKERLYKNELVNSLYDYIKIHCLKVIEKTRCDDVNLVDIGKIIMKEFDIWLGDEINSIDIVLIENQIAPIANRMKTIQGMISQYFIMRGVNNIQFVSSSHKLNEDIQKQIQSHIHNDGDFREFNHKVKETTTSIDTLKVSKGKEFYKERKNAGLSVAEKILSIIQEKDHHNFKEFFKNHSKKDDLADCFLQGIWYIYQL